MSCHWVTNGPSVDERSSEEPRLFRGSGAAVPHAESPSLFECTFISLTRSHRSVALTYRRAQLDDNRTLLTGMSCTEAQSLWSGKRRLWSGLRRFGPRWRVSRDCGLEGFLLWGYGHSGLPPHLIMEVKRSHIVMFMHPAHVCHSLYIWRSEAAWKMIVDTRFIDCSFIFTLNRY